MLDKQDWEVIGAYLATYDGQREAVIKQTRDVQKLAKQAIYCLHRGDVDAAQAKLQAAEDAASELLPIVKAEPALRTGSFSGAMEEYAEAKVFLVFLQEKRLLRSSELAALVQTDEYLGGVLDFAGELNRHAVMCATQRDTAAVSRCRDIVDAIMGQFLELDLRNGTLRKKYDGLKYTLKKLETLLYELSLSSTLSFKSREAEPEEQHELPTGGE